MKKNNSFSNKLKHVLHQFPKYHMEIFLGNLNKKLGRKYTFKTTICHD
jgi:hypothetical protein